MLSRRPLAAALRLAPLSPPLLLFFASSSSSSPASCSSPAASASGPRGCSALRMDSGAVEPASTGAIWSTPSVEPRSISIGKQIFCNRSLNMRNITAVGFDMDYTLAQYKPETFEALAYHGTIEKLVKDLNYPEELLTWQFDWKYMVRGLVLDKKRGNILKMDRHKYVKVAYHGFREMSKEEKVAAYGSTLIRDSFDEPDYALIDTLFSLGEAYLFAQLVDFMDSNPAKVPSGTDYALMYRDVRSAVDLCHRDGTLKRMVAKEPSSRYINEDLAIVPMLQMLRKSGRSTFLVTNSLWDYTDVVMNYLCGPHMSDVSSSHNQKWLEYFDVVITGSSKPSFFHDDNRTGLFEVEPDSGKLLNADLQESKVVLMYNPFL
uniref:Cytosolic purine 5'-nucleotidase n=1 Tax=Aegilops tauschii subsp. strangulata TaxID=200361 RepID=A0A453LX31_AEGTS